MLLRCLDRQLHVRPDRSSKPNPCIFRNSEEGGRIKCRASSSAQTNKTGRRRKLPRSQRISGISTHKTTTSSTITAAAPPTCSSATTARGRGIRVVDLRSKPNQTTPRTVAQPVLLRRLNQNKSGNVGRDEYLFWNSQSVQPTYLSCNRRRGRMQNFELCTASQSQRYDVYKHRARPCCTVAIASHTARSTPPATTKTAAQITARNATAASSPLADALAHL